MSTSPPVLLPWPRPRPSWRALALLTAAVALMHLFLLGWLPMSGAQEELPLAHRFSTRTIVIAPPAATGGGAPAASAPVPAPAAGTGPTARLREKPREVPPPSRAQVEPDVPAPAPSAQTTPEPPNPPETPKQLAPEAPLPPPAEAPLAEPTPVAEAPAGPNSSAQVDAPDPSAGTAAAASAEPQFSRAPLGAGGGGVGTGQGAGDGAGAGAGTPGARLPMRVPPSVRLDFAVTGQQGMQPMSGVFGELVWLQDGATYNARLALRVLFRTIRTQTSVGRLSPAGIEPSRFSDARRSEVATHFVRESGQIVFSSTTTPAPLLPGAQDRLSVILQLSALLAGDPQRYPPGSSFSVQTAGPRDAEMWQFSVDGDEALDTPAGPYPTRKLTRLPRKEHDQKIELWLAPELGWLPVRIRQTQSNGDFADMQLRSSGSP